MSIRNTLLAATLALSSAVALGDPPSGPPPGMRGPPIERLTKDLGLNETQAAQVKQIFDTRRTQMEAERAQFEASGTRPSREEMHAKREQADAELHQQLAAVLTPEQLAKFDEIRKQQRPHGPPPGEDGGQPPQQQ